MPQVPIEIINLNGNAGFNEGIVNGNIEGAITAGVEISADICHGIALGIDASAVGQVLGNLDFLFIGAQAQGEVSAAAGAKILFRLEPNLLEGLGLSVYLGAYARAMASGSLSVYLTTEYISQKVQDNLDDFATDLFLIFAEEVKAEIGVWGRVAFSAMAEMNLNVVLDVNRLQSGFQVSGGYKLGLEAGAGYDFFCDVGFKNLRRAVNRSSIRVSTELKQWLLESDIPQKRVLSEALDFSLPLVVLLSFDLGNKCVERGEFLETAEVAEVFHTNFMSNCQRYAIDKMFEAAVLWITDEFVELYERLVDAELDQDDRDLLDESIEEVTLVLRKSDFRLEDISVIVVQIVNIVDALDQGSLDNFNRPISLLWISAILGLEIRELLSSVSASVGVGSTATGSASVSLDEFSLPAAPALVKQEVGDLLGLDIVEIDLSQSIDYLIEVGIEATQTRIFPQIAEFKDLFETNFPALTLGDLFEDGIRGLKGEGDLQSYNSYLAVKSFVKKDLIDDLILKELLPKITAESASPLLVTYANEVVKPSLHLSTGFIFVKLDNILIDDLSSISNLPAFVNGISSGCGAVVYRILARNIAFFDEVVSEFVLDNTYSAFEQLSNQFGNDQDPFYLSCKQLLSQTMPFLPNLDENAEAVRQLLVDLANAFKEISGPTIYTYERRIEMRNLKRDILLSMAGDIDYASSTDVFVDRLLDCNHIPNKDLSDALGRLMLEIGIESFVVFMEKILPALGDFFLSMSLIQLRELKSNLLQFIDSLRAAAQNKIDAYNALSDRVDQEILSVLSAVDSLVEDFRSRFNDHLSEWGTSAENTIYMAQIEGIRSSIPAGGVRDAAILSFENIVWPIESHILSTAISGATLILETTVNALALSVDSATDLAVEMVKLKQDVEDAITSGLIGYVLNPIASTATMLVESLIPQTLLDDIEDYLENRRIQKELEIEKLAAEQELAILEIDKARSLEKYDRNNFNSLVDLKIYNPINHFQFIYAKQLTLSLFLEHGNFSMVSDPDSNRIQLLLNGKNVDIPVSNWSQSAGGMFFDAELDGVKNGLNVLELSWIKGATESDTVRQTISFAVDASALYTRANFDVSIVHNPPGYDVDSEYILFHYKGDEAMLAEGWMIQDRAGHKFFLPAMTLKPDDTLKIYTGGSKSMDKADKRRKHKFVHMGRKKAVWNNEGDTMYLVDKKNVLIYLHTYQG